MRTKEIWKPIRGYTGRYEVSNKGRVRSVIKRKDNTRKNIILKPSQSNNYEHLRLYKNGEGKDFRVNRLVAAAFISKRNRYAYEVDHKNGNSLDNRLSNLRYVTHKQNQKYMRSRQKALKSR